MEASDIYWYLQYVWYVCVQGVQGVPSQAAVVHDSSTLFTFSVFHSLMGGLIFSKKNCCILYDLNRLVMLKVHFIKITDFIEERRLLKSSFENQFTVRPKHFLFLTTPYSSFEICNNYALYAAFSPRQVSKLGFHTTPPPNPGIAERWN